MFILYIQDEVIKKEVNWRENLRNWLQVVLLKKKKQQFADWILFGVASLCLLIFLKTKAILPII